MPELPGKRAMARLRRTTLSVICALPLGGLAATALAQDLPEGLRACAAVPDSGRRLACYDSEMARLSGKPARTTRPAMASAPSGPLTATPPPNAVAPAATAPKSGSREPARRRSPWRFFTGGPASQLTARITRLDRSPDAMVLHLDNGQVWRQIGRASGDLGLHPGDRVTIERHLGSYWLSSRHVSAMHVRLEPR